MRKAASAEPGSFWPNNAIRTPADRLNAFFTQGRRVLEAADTLLGGHREHPGTTLLDQRRPLSAVSNEVDMFAKQRCDRVGPALERHLGIFGAGGPLDIQQDQVARSTLASGAAGQLAGIGLAGSNQIFDRLVG